LPPLGGCQLADWGCYRLLAEVVIKESRERKPLPPLGGCQLADWGCFRLLAEVVIKE